MKAMNGNGVLTKSEVYFFTPSATARKLFYYMTCCGHYFCDGKRETREEYTSTSRRSRDLFLLVYIRRGTVDIENGAAGYTAVKGQTVMIDCRQPYRLHPQKDTEAVWIHAGGVNMRDFFEQIVSFHGGKQVFCPSAGSGIYTDMLKLIEEQGKNGWFHESLCSLRIYELLCSLLLKENPDDSRRDDAVSEAIAFINKHFQEELTVDDIAMAVNLSSAYFSRNFRSSTGFSPHEYIILRRISEAKRLLHESGKPVREIAYEVGYQNEVTFITSFKEKVGMPPAAFRRSVM